MDQSALMSGEWRGSTCQRMRRGAISSVLGHCELLKTAGSTDRASLELAVATSTQIHAGSPLVNCWRTVKIEAPSRPLLLGGNQLSAHLLGDLVEVNL